ARGPRNPRSTRNRVVFPAPFAPTTATISPARPWRDTSRSTAPWRGYPACSPRTRSRGTSATRAPPPPGPAGEGKEPDLGAIGNLPHETDRPGSHPGPGPGLDAPAHPPPPRLEEVESAGVLFQDRPEDGPAPREQEHLVE